LPNYLEISVSGDIGKKYFY